MAKTNNWTTVAESKYSWEREALDFVREQFPSHDPYRAWANFEFIADDGSINEVDLLVFTPQGFFLVEIKSRPGRLLGDAGTWTWDTDGKYSTVDNPLVSANLKAKKLRSLLQRQKAFKKKGQPPFVEALVFCSAPELRNELQGNARLRVCLRDRPASGDKPARQGIMAALLRRECPGVESYAKGTHDRPMAKVVSQAMDQAGIRPSQRMRKVNDYLLEQLIDEGPGYQDWQASHTQIENSKRRVRLYLVRLEASEEDRTKIQRAAQREYQILETLEHPGILRASGFTEHELGPALLFEHDPSSIRLDHYLSQRQGDLRIDVQLDLVRQIAEVIAYAHEKKVIHRGLCPQSILVSTHNGKSPRIKIFNWQIGYREGTTSVGVSRGVTATSHIDRLVDDAATGYMAPEALTDANSGEQLDVFSLGAIAYHIFSGVVPAANAVELSEKLRETKGLQISSVLNGADEWLQEMIRLATHPVVPDRMGTVGEFLEHLDLFENALTSDEHDYVEDPSRAQFGDLLPGGYKVVRRLGQGASSVGLLVEREGQDFILKVANDPDHNARLKDEADVLRKQEMRHACIVDVVELLEVGQYFGFLMRPVYAEKEKRLIETLGQRMRKEGRLHIDLLHRFGEDLLGVVNYLEEQGIPHRDIKPDNITVGMVGRANKLHLVLFDFSLSRTPAENIRAGTTGYLDPLLPLRKPPRWDLHAERYAAAITLYEMATGTLPVWGDGTTDPSHLASDVEITIDAELFEMGLRDSLQAFFRKAFRRDTKARFDNAEDMLRSWRQCFEGLDESGPLSDHADEATLQELLSDVTFDTHITELGLGTRATNALDRANILTVEDLLTVPMRRLLRLRGVGNKTRREIAAAVKILRQRLGQPDGGQQLVPDSSADEDEAIDAGSLSVDLVADRLRKTGNADGDNFQQTVQLLLGFESEDGDAWISQTNVAEKLGITRARVGQFVGKLRERWAKYAPLSRLRSDLADTLRAHGGVMSARELGDAILVARGSTHDEPLRTQLAQAVVRAATEVERSMAEPRYLVRRDEDSVLISLNAELASYAIRLGEVADKIATEDPLLAPARVIERLRQISAASTIPLTDARLVRLAAEASKQAALSSRQELYPRGMDAARALKLSQGALLGQKQLTVEQIQDRVSGRYPEASPLPQGEALDELLRQGGFEFRWDPTSKNGVGSYISTVREFSAVTSGTETAIRRPTNSSHLAAGDVTPEVADARQFEERLQRSAQEGAFLALLVNPKYYERAQEELCRRFPLQPVDFEGLFLDSLQATAEKAKVQWDLVLNTDTQPNQGDWDKLMMLVSRTMPSVEKDLLAAEKTMLLAYPGMLARYGQMDLLSRLSQKVGRPGGIPGLWLLLPGDSQAMIDGKPVPLIGPGQRALIPESWIQNLHRGNGKS
ncbi:BREX system serine/threonine kinase PglW [Blastopirellula marina]|uniref:BREX system serine/threonine kinase PglW n=1 Tax=Blastopirellula marina TaxID=124 RepID=A0A2S8FAH8_9BACT|nr:BREX system serine/threonine kinase PglW [Blastopirellula marina]PQO28934.1 BREX system serine/threonine kinase PglW [Blastopirellula marina]PTL42207.1 BREX system serine/threonine kinase PglW [Blastopirellula marina]